MKDAVFEGGGNDCFVTCCFSPESTIEELGAEELNVEEFGVEELGVICNWRR